MGLGIRETEKKKDAARKWEMMNVTGSVKACEYDLNGELIMTASWLSKIEN